MSVTSFPISVSRWFFHCDSSDGICNIPSGPNMNVFLFSRESRGLGSACSVERGTGIGPAQTFLSPETPPPASAASISTYRKLEDRPSRELHERIQQITVQRCLYNGDSSFCSATREFSTSWHLCAPGTKSFNWLRRVRAFSTEWDAHEAKIIVSR